MTTAQEPLVCVLTPVYNGERYLGECIDSVLRQTYRNWRYIIVNNRSTDRSREIAESYAARDGRITVLNPDEFLKAMPNWNRTIRQLPPEAKYCKFVHADDFLFPECISRMVEVAEEYPTVGIVGAYRLRGKGIQSDGLPYPATVMPGREVCRRTLWGGFYVFGTPTNILYRSDVIDLHSDFYDEDLIHSDVDAAYSILRRHDFGFVHQVLSYSRQHEESHTSTVAYRYATNNIENLYMVKKHGPDFFEPAEYRELEDWALRRYYLFRARTLLKGAHREYLPYHVKIMQRMGMKDDRRRLAGAMLSIVTDKLFNPKRALGNTVNKHPRRGD